MKCPKCNAELTEDTKFCSYCGTKIEANMPGVEQINTGSGEYEAVPINSASDSEFAQKNESKAAGLWKRLGMFEKIMAILLGVFVLGFLVALLAGKTVAAIMAVLQIALCVVAFLIDKKIIKLQQVWLKFIAVALAIVLSAGFVGALSMTSIPNTSNSDSDNNGNSDSDSDSESIVWSELVLGKYLPELESPEGKVSLNSKDSLILDINNITPVQYNKYVETCKENDYTFDVEENGVTFSAYNSSGYSLSMVYAESKKTLRINLDAPKEFEKMVWPDSGLASLLPKPDSNKGAITKNDSSEFTATVGNTSLDNMTEYVKKCAEKGFTEDKSGTQQHYIAKNKDGVKVDVEYKGGNVIEISVFEAKFDITLDVKCEKNLVFSKYNVKIYIDDNNLGTLEHGTSDTYTEEVTKGIHKVKFVSEDNNSLNGEVKIDVTKSETFEFEISCSSLGITVDVISGTVPTEAPTTEAVTEKKTEPERETTKPVEEDSSDDDDDYDYAVLNINNCPELKKMLNNKAEIDSSYTDFAEKYAGRTIEFDGRIDYCTNHGTYKTRFDYLVSSGNYDPDHQIGPSFKFDNVSYNDLNTDLDSVNVGQNVHIVAKVESFNSSTGLFLLDPVSVKGR